ncbi:sigma-54-dependent transcriptional regulator [Rufibacter roseolus]|uniref:sigma-54-dependent transcriptional regulator n=1 Tax=Rufibacter roseolus TaxID=2817375 RepID=UPI001B3125C6|nr:sigma-54 dependent transcriptional regulator [Rufibacter roseolus]
MSKMTCRILIVDDQEDILTAGRIFLKQHFSLVRTEINPQRLPDLLQKEPFDVILLDMNYTAGATSSREGLDLLQRILEVDPQAVVVMMTAYGDIDLAVQALKLGATDFVVKPWHNEKLLATMISACKLRQSTSEVQHLRTKQQHLNQTLNEPGVELVGSSPAMQRVYQTLEKVAATDANVLILGENGTGKEVAARLLHRLSHRAKEVFIPVDLGAVTESLFESELFGHVKGSFTDAKEDRAGRFEVASGGTLFLDEIGNLNLPLQAKLLTALQSRVITPVGSNRPRPVNIRLVSATNMPLYEMVKQGRFRQDLLYRINTVEIHLPPLRERKEDIQPLAEHFLASFSKKYQKPNLRLEKAVLQKLLGYSWPGNIRELEHTMERAVIMSEPGHLHPSDVYLAEPSTHTAVTLDTEATLGNVEKTLVQQALLKHNGNITHASKELGITRTALYRRIEKHGL